MKSLAFILSLIPLFPLLAQDAPKGDPRGKGKSKQRPPKFDFIKRYDENKDLKLSRAEFDQGERAKKLEEAVRAKLFARLDKNGDGFITRDELPKMPGRSDDLHWIGKADSNKDGRISFDEFAKSSRFKDAPKDRLKAMFEHFDRNKDGFLDSKDHPERRHDHRRPMPKLSLKELDRDQNNSLSWEEFKNAPAVLELDEETQKRLFGRLDDDKDGALSAEELKKGHDRDRRGRSERKGDRGPDQERKGPKK